MDAKTERGLEEELENLFDGWHTRPDGVMDRVEGHVNRVGETLDIKAKESEATAAENQWAGDGREGWRLG